MLLAKPPNTLKHTKLKFCDCDQLMQELFKNAPNKKSLNDSDISKIHASVTTDPDDFMKAFKQENEELYNRVQKNLPAKADMAEFKTRIQALADGIKYSDKENNLLEYLTSLIYKRALLCHYKSDIAKPDKEATYDAIYYIISIRMRFVRSMLAMHGYTDNEFDAQWNATEAQDEYGWRKVNKEQMMKLARGVVNRYIVNRRGGIYTTVGDHTEERAKFGFYDANQGPVSVQNFKSKQITPIWKYSDCSILQRITESCTKFEEFAADKLITVCANYFRIDNPLKIRDKRLDLQYIAFKKDSSELYSLLVPSGPKEDCIVVSAPLHTIVEGKYHQCMNNKPFSIDDKKVEYNLIGPDNRNACYDIYGLLYAVRKGVMGVAQPKYGFHSTIWSGKKIQAAGMIATWKGKITAIDNASGHYKPNWYLLYNALTEFYNKGVFHENALVGIVTCVKGKWCNQFFHVDDFFRLGSRDFPLGETLGCIKRDWKLLEEFEKEGILDQHQAEECKSVVRLGNLLNYKSIWSDKADFTRKDLAQSFLVSMEYDWNKIFHDVYSAYDGFVNGKIETKLTNRIVRLQDAVMHLDKSGAPKDGQRLKAAIAEAGKKQDLVLPEFKTLCEKHKGVAPTDENERYALADKMTAISEVNGEVMDLLADVARCYLTHKVNQKPTQNLNQDIHDGLFDWMKPFEEIAYADVAASKKATLTKSHNVFYLEAESQPKPPGKTQSTTGAVEAGPGSDDDGGDGHDESIGATSTEGTTVSEEPTSSSEMNRQPEPEKPKSETGPAKQKKTGAPYRCSKGHESYFSGTCRICGEYYEKVN